MTGRDGRGRARRATPVWLSRERIVAKPGFNRWLVPPAALAIHLCIGMAYGFSVFWLPLSRALIGGHRVRGLRRHGAVLRPCSPPPATGGSATSAWIYTLVLRRPRACRPPCSAAGWSGRARARPASWPPCAGAAASLIGALGVYHPPALADLARLGPDRRHRPRPRLHLPGLDPDQVVPRPARHGHRHGDHGLRRRRDDRLAAGRQPDQDASRPPTSVGVWQTLAGDGASATSCSCWAAPSATACRRPAGSPDGLDARRPPRTPMIAIGHVHLRDAHKTAAVLADLGGAVPQRLGRHRRARRWPRRCCRRSSAAR